MKKFIGIALVLALAVMLMPGAVFADDPCTTVINWSGGGGLITGSVTAGSTLATTNFMVLGNNINGQFVANYTGIGGGPYGGSSYNSKMDVGLTNGAIEYQTVRGAFGYTNGGDPENGGFSSYSFVGSGAWNQNMTQFTTGTGAVSMKTCTSTSAPITKHTGVDTSLVDNTYGWVGTNQHNFQATGTSAFSIIRQLTAANTDFSSVSAVGTGDAYLDNIGSKAGRTASMCGGPLSGYDFSWGQDFGANNGSGLLTVQGKGSNSVTLTDLSATGINPATSWFASTGTLSIVGSGLKATGTGTSGSCTINQNVGWNSPAYGAFTYNKAIINSQ
jgi:hypothetical protein